MLVLRRRWRGELSFGRTLPERETNFEGRGNKGKNSIRMASFFCVVLICSKQAGR